MKWFDISISVLRVITLSMALYVWGRLFLAAVRNHNPNGLSRTRSALLWLFAGIITDPLIRVLGWIVMLGVEMPSIHYYYRTMRIPLLLAYIPLVIGIHKMICLIGSKHA